MRVNNFYGRLHTFKSVLMAGGRMFAAVTSLTYARIDERTHHLWTINVGLLVTIMRAQYAHIKHLVGKFSLNNAHQRCVLNPMWSYFRLDKLKLYEHLNWKIPTKIKTISVRVENDDTW